MGSVFESHPNHEYNATCCRIFTRMPPSLPTKPPQSILGSLLAMQVTVFPKSVRWPQSIALRFEKKTRHTVMRAKSGSQSFALNRDRLPFFSRNRVSPPCDVQNDGTEMPGVGNEYVDCDGGLHEGVRLHLSQFYLGGTQILQCRSRIRQPPEENIQRSEGVSTDRRRE